MGNMLLVSEVFEKIRVFLERTGVYQSNVVDNGWKLYVMIIIACILYYMAIARNCEPNLLIPIATGMLLINIPGAYEILYSAPFTDAVTGKEHIGGLFYYLSKGVEWVIFPPIIFLGIGAMTDFGPLIANPKSLLLGAAAQIGIFITFIGAKMLGFSDQEAAAIGIIGGADGPTAIYVTSKLAEGLLGAIAISAYSYMALIPIIQPPIMKLLTTKKERAIRMEQLKPVSKRAKIIFPIAVTVICGLIVPDSLPLVGMLMFGNILRESGVVGRLSDTAQNGLINTITIFLGVCVGVKTYAYNFLDIKTLSIIGLGLVAFMFATASGVMFGKLLCWLSKGKINPLIGAAGVSAVPMAARVAQKVGQEEDPHNYLLMHAMGSNVAGVIGSAVAAGFFLAFFG